MKTAVVFGIGRIGAAIARDLAADATVTAVDHRREALDSLPEAITREEADLTDPRGIAELASRHDLTILALPGYMGFEALSAIVHASTPVVDISFSDRDPFALHDEAARRGIPVIVDAGLAPGLNNLLLGHALATSERVDQFGCYVGGLPANPTPPWNYKAPFSPIDVIEEYTRPARHRRDGKLLTSDALTDLEPISFSAIGEAEAFLTDGLRSLLRLDDVRTMWEKTVRYPGHAELMRNLRTLGLFGTEAVDVRGVEVVPRDVTARSLFSAWEYGPGEPDLTVMRVAIDAVREGASERTVFDLVDRYDESSDTSSMARTTGYTCTATARLLLRDQLDDTGVLALEDVGRRSEWYESILHDLGERAIHISSTRTPLPS